MPSSDDPIEELNALAEEYPELRAIAASIENQHAEIRTNQEALELTFARLGHVILKIDPATRTVVHANEAIEHVFGYTPDEIVGSSTSLLHLDEHSYAEFGRVSEDVLRRGEMFETEYRMRRRDGSTFPAEISVRSIHAPDSWREGVVSVIHDLSQIKAQEDVLNTSQTELERTSLMLRALFESALDAIALIDDEARYIDVNPAAVTLTGYSKEELVGRGLQEFTAKQSADGFARRWQAFVERGWSTGEFELVGKDGRKRVLEFSSVANVLPGVHISVNRDITERKENQERLKAALAERELLLREVHHRVKNNLQLIISMLRLEAQRNNEECERAALEAARLRVEAISLTYERLLQESNLANVRMDLYVEKLVGVLREVVSMPNVTVDVAPVWFEIDRAIPFGLLLNELLTNCGKHAFSAERAAARVEVRLSEVDNRDFTLSVVDNGIGLPGDLDTANPETLGLQLVQALAAQMEGAISFSGDEGTRVAVRFPRE